MPRNLRTLAAKALGALVLTVALGEVALRIHNPIHLPQRANEIVLPAGKTFVQRHPANAKIDPECVNSYNSIGLRGPEPPADFADALTVVTVGGSTTACLSQTDRRTWPALMAAELAETLPGLWVNNAGFDGHSTFGHLQLLRQVLADLEPDVIVYMAAVNDVGRADLNEYDAALSLESMSLRDRIVASSELLCTLQVVYRRLRAVELGVCTMPDMDFAALPVAETDPTEAEATLTEHRDTHAPGYRERLTALVHETRAASIVPILMTQPALYGSGEDPTLGIPLDHLVVVDPIDARTQWRILETYNDITREVAAAEGVHLIDLARELPKDSRYYFDWIHYSNEGSEAVAGIVAEWLREPLGRIASENDERRAQTTEASAPADPHHKEPAR